MVKVSVIVITYGHEKYIGQAIEGILMQECGFEVELIIADDCSPDDTESVVKQYIENHPRGHWIRYTKHIKNKGMQPNFAWAYAQARGKYIALCEGDDYWIEKTKLQKQVSFLQENDGYILCGHRVHKLLFDGHLEESRAQTPVSFSQSQLFDFHIPTLSAVFHRIPLEFPDTFNSSPAGDFFLWVLLGSAGRFYLFDEAMAIYRMNESGNWSTLSPTAKLKISLQTKLLAANFMLEWELAHFKLLKIAIYGFYICIREKDFRSCLFLFKTVFSLLLKLVFAKRRTA